MTRISISSSQPTTPREILRSAQGATSRPTNTRPSEDAVVLEIAQQLAKKAEPSNVTPSTSDTAEISEAVFQILVAAQELARSFEAVISAPQVVAPPSAKPTSSPALTEGLLSGLTATTRGDTRPLDPITSFAQELSSISKNGSLNPAQLIEAANPFRFDAEPVKSSAAITRTSPSTETLSKAKAFETYDSSISKELPRAIDFKVAV